MKMYNIPCCTIRKVLGDRNRPTTEIYLHSLHGSEARFTEVYECLSKKSHKDSHTGLITGVG